MEATIELVEAIAGIIFPEIYLTYINKKIN